MLSHVESLRDAIHLVSPDEDGVGHRQQPHQRPVLEESQNLRLISEALVNTHLLHLGHQHLTTVISS